MISRLDRAGAPSRGPRVLRARARPADAAGHGRLAGCAADQPGGLGRRGRAGGLGRPGAARRRPAGRGGARAVERGALRRGAVRRPDGPGLRRRRPGAVARGANSVIEAAAVGLPAIFVPLPIGNGEQEHNARPVVDAGGALLVADADLTPTGSRPRCRSWRPTATRLAAMGAAASALVPRDADERLARIVLEVAGSRGPAMKVPVPDVLLPAEELGRVHFVGIGGAGLSAIARIMAARGLPVTGSDDQDTPFLPRCASWASPVISATPPTTSATPTPSSSPPPRRDDNPEVVEARRRGLRVLPRSAGLWSVMAGRRVLAVAGTHGKTTTTSLLVFALLAADADPSYAVGGTSPRPGATPTTAPATCSSPRPTRATAPSSSTGRTPRSSPTSHADHLDVWGTEEAYRAGVRRVRRDGRPRRLPGLLRRRRRRARAGRPSRAREVRRVVTVGEAATPISERPA